FITPDEHVVTRQVTAALAADDLLFQRDGVVVRPIVLEADDQPLPTSRRLVWRRPAGLTLLRPAERAFVRLRITERCLLLAQGKKEVEHKNPPAWLVPAVQAEPGAVRPVEGLLPSPTIDTEVRLIEAPGYDPATRWFLARTLAGLE